MAERFAKLKEEFYKLLPPTIYFFVTLHIVALVRMLMTRGTTFPASSTMSINRRAHAANVRFSTM